VRSLEELEGLLSQFQADADALGLGSIGFRAAVPVTPEEGDMLLGHLQGTGRGFTHVAAVLSADRFYAAKAERQAATPVWCSVPGGRAAHAFIRGADVPVCGVRPVRADGTAPPWREGDIARRWAWGLARRHGQCVRVLRRMIADGALPVGVEW
jgi:hypothetical protein